MLQILFKEVNTMAKVYQEDDNSLSHLKTTTSVTKSSHQDRGLCYLHSPIFSYTYTLLFC